MWFGAVAGEPNKLLGHEQGPYSERGGIVGVISVRLGFDRLAEVPYLLHDLIVRVKLEVVQTPN